LRIAALIDHVGAAIRNHLSGGRARLPMVEGQSSPRFADYARARLGLPEVDLFSQVEQPDKQEWAALASGNGANAPTSTALSPDGS